MTALPIPQELEARLRIPLKKERCGYPEARPSKVWGLETLPGHWREKPLKYVAGINTDKLSDDTDPDYEIGYVDIGNVTLIEGITSTERFRFEAAPSRARRLVRDGDTIVSTVRTYLKAVAHIKEPPVNLVVSTGFAVIRPGPQLDRGYLYRLAQCEAFVERIMAHSVGVSYPGINASEIGTFTVPLPPLDEQRAIARFLDHETAKIDELIATKLDLVQKLEAKRGAEIRRAFTSGIEAGVRRKDSGIDWLGEIPAHWELIRIGYLANFRGGCTPSKDKPAYWNGDLPWVTPKDMKAEVIDDSEDHVTEDALRETGLRMIDFPVVLIVVRGMILAHSFPVALTAKPVTINQDMKALKPGAKLNADFFAWVLRASAPAFFAIVEESGHGTRVLRTDLWSKQRLPVPPIAEQIAIVEHAKQVTARIDFLQGTITLAIDKLRQYRSGLISAAVTGQLDVRSYRGEAACPLTA